MSCGVGRGSSDRQDRVRILNPNMGRNRGVVVGA